MKKNILIIAGVATLLSLGTTVKADEPGTGHTTEVIPGDWDDEEEPTLNFNFQDIPQAKYEGLKLHLSCGLPGAKILYTTDPNATKADNGAWTEYTGPIELTEDCTLRFFGRCEGYNDSDIQSYKFVYADHQAAAPTLAPDIDRKNVVMVTDTPDAIIRYTFDGSEPTEASTAYESPVTITANGLFRARSFANEMFPSVVTDFTVDFMVTETPVVAFENRHLVLSCNDEAAKIYYTTSDAAVEDAQAWTAYTAPVALTEDCTVRYFARHEGYHDSEVGSFAFFYTEYQVAAPILEANPEGTHIVMTCETYGSTIHYTTDGSEPTEASPLYSEPVEITSNGLFRARAYADGLFDSNIVDFSVMHLAVPTPTAVFENKKFVIECSDSKATVWYTTDVAATTDDMSAWTEYKAPIELTTDCTVRFFGRRTGFNDSDVQTFTFAYADHQVADPTIERDAEGTHLVMETTTAGATIHYTADGTEPTEKSAVYTEPILLDGNFTYSAIAVAEGMFNSGVNRYVVSNMAVTAPSATFENMKMALSCADEKAQIWYTVNAEATVDDIQGWTRYTAPFDMTGDCTLRFFSRRDNYKDSDVQSLTFVYSAYQAQAPSIVRNSQGTHIVMTTAVEGGSIRYTTDGSDPTAQSALYEAPVRIQEGVTYRARVFADNMYASVISEYMIGNDKLAVPTATYDNFTLVLSTADEGASIWYTTDPALTLENVEAWTLYSEPIVLGDDCTYRFFAGDDDANASDVQTFVFQKSDWQVALPTIERDAEGTHLVMATPTEGAEIRYTTDGSEPTAESTLYAEPVLIKCNGTFRARAFVKGMYDSEVADFVVANMATPVAYATFENKLLTLTCADAEAEIWYTNDDDAVPEEMENWQLYSLPIALTEDCWVHFFTRRENFNDSDIETFVFLRANYTAAAPKIDRNEDGREILMSTDTEGGEIRYTTDGTDPTDESGLYTGPVFITQNCTFRARTFAEGLFESAISEYSVSNMTMMTPHSSFENLLLTLTVWDEAAAVWYTLNPDALPEDVEEWTLYTEPIALTADCTVRYFARRTGFLDSSIDKFEFVYADYQVAAPVIERTDEGITMTTATENAEIRYTTDGTEPTAESTLYTEPVAIEGNFTLRARAFAEGLFDSEIAEITVDDQTVAVPTAEFINKALTLTADNEATAIRYTTDAEATVENTEAWTLYTEPIALTADCTVRFYGCRDGFNDSEIGSFEFVYADYQVAAPVIERTDEGITMTTATENAEIRYTTDGTEPTAESTLYTEPVAIEGNFTLRARAFAEGLFDSEIAEITVDDQTVAVPTAEFINKALTLTADNEATVIRYTTDAEATVENTEAWTLYTEPIALTADCTVRFYGCRDGFNDSEIGSFEFVYTAYQVATPAFEHTAEGIAMTTATENAEIRYTTDGTEPTPESTLYTAPVAIEGNFTLRAKAFAEGLFDSEIAEITVDDQTVTVPTAKFINKALTLTADNEATAIRYTTDAEATVENTEAWTLYTEPIALTADCTVRFYGHRDGFNDSEIGSFEFVYADYQVAAPVIERTDEGITMTTATENAEIRYTTDGTEPTAESTLYTEPVAIEGNFTLRARAFAEGLFDSEIAEITVDDQTVTVPTAKFINKALTLTADNEATAIRYTTDAEATVENTEAWTLYTEPIALTADCTVRFYGHRDGFNDSEIGSFEFVYADYQVAAPVIERTDEGITMTTATENAEIRYTTDGSMPTEESTLYTEPVAIEGNFTLLARAFAEGLFDSEIAEITVDDQTVAVPTAEFINKALTLTADNEATVIRYTTDAEATVENTEAWTLYTEPIALTADCTVRFFGHRDGFNDSEIGSFEFVYADYQVAAPVFDYDKYANIVAITCETEGAVIRYTTDGSEPTAESTIYTDVITVDQDMTIRARAFVEGLFDSEVVECEVAPSTTGIAAVNVEGASIRVSREGANLIIYSDGAVTVPMYDMRGILIRVIDLENGRNVVSGLTRGTYIIAGKKIMM